MPAVRDDDVVALGTRLRRQLAGRAAPADVDDVVQETLSRLWAARDRLDAQSLPAYAAVSARNLLADRGREAQRARRLAPRLHEPRPPTDPAEASVASEESRALATALSGLEPGDRQALIDHVLGGDDLARLGGERSTSRGALGARLARVRARLRVDHVLAMRRISDLPSPACHPLLVAVSAADTRRQRRLGLDEHLLTCPVCPQLVAPLSRRDRRLTGLLPLPAAGALAEVPGWMRARLPQLGASGAAAAAVAAIAVAVSAGGSPERVAAPAVAAVEGLFVVDDEIRVPLQRSGELRGMAGRPVTGTGLPVLEVTGDEAMWVGTGPHDRVHLQLLVEESAERVRVGDRIDVAGRLEVPSAAFADAAGVRSEQGRQDLVTGGVYVAADTWTVHPGG